MKNIGHLITEVYPESIAEEMEIEPGDTLLEINGQEIEDVFDYRFMIKDEYIEVLIRKADGEEWLLEIEKDYDDDLGMEFENGLMSEYRSCTNKCIFCFIDQMPPGMRETLYFKDDDSRLSFLQGNYITLTNMQDKDIDRIIRMQLAPINVSVHTTNPELRCKMLNNRFAGDKLKYIDKLYNAHIEMNGQIVCCKNVNDGEELRRTITDLGKYLPFMRSVSVVPAGITKFRDGLYPIEMFTKEEAAAVIDMIEEYQKLYYEQYGLHFIHASDEWYISAGRDFPEEERYDGYIQLENGVGMMRLLMDEFEEGFQKLLAREDFAELQQKVDRNITLVTGLLPYSTLHGFADRLMEVFPKLQLQVYYIRNDFFGETITVTGLVTGIDIVNQMKERRQKGEDIGDTIFVPSNMLRSGEQVFLDDMTVSDIEEQLNVRVVPVEVGGKTLIEAVLQEDYFMDRHNDEDDEFVYIDVYKDY
jgi:putative radical SAM enzyme (TIGR03279 family)